MCSPVADKVSTASKARFHLHVATMRQSFLLQTTLHGNKTKKHPFNFFINCHNVSPSFFIFLDCFGWKWCGLSETMESVLYPHHLVTFTLLWIRSGQIEMWIWMENSPKEKIAKKKCAWTLFPVLKFCMKIFIKYQSI